MIETVTEGAFRVWWIPQVPGKPFYVDVDTYAQGEWLEKVLADYDLFQYAENVKGDYANAGGVERFEGDEWVTYDRDAYEEEEGVDTK